MESQYKIAAYRADGAARLNVSGELDLADAGRFYGDVVQYAGGAPQSPSEIDLDLSELTFVDSSGLQAIVSVHDDLTSSGRVVHILRPSYAVRRVFEITGLRELLSPESR